MMKCIEYGFIKSLIEHGYNGVYPKAVVIFKRILDGDNWVMPTDLRILMDNGFDKHIQSILMYSITYSTVTRLEMLLEYGANFYSILHDLHYYVSFERNLLTDKVGETLDPIQLDENEDIVVGRVIWEKNNRFNIIPKH